MLARICVRLIQTAVFSQLFWFVDNKPACLGGNLTIAEPNDFNLCGVRGAGAWYPVINATFQDVQQSYLTPYTDNSEQTFAVNFSLTADRTLNNETLNYECSTYFLEPNFSSKDTNNRQYAVNAPVFSDSCSGNLLMDVQCKSSRMTLSY